MRSFFSRLWRRQSSSVVSGAAIIAAASFASRLLGVFRDHILAGEFGAGHTLDVYYAAFRLPDLIYNLLIVGALSAGFIPVFVAAKNSASKNEHWHIANVFLTTTVIGLAAVCTLMIMFSPMIMPWLTPGFGPEKTAEVAQLSRVIFLSPLLLGASAVLGGVLQSFRNFFVYSLAPIFYNIGIIIGALFFVPRFGTIGLAWGVVLGAGLHFLIQIPAVHALKWPFRFSVDLKNSGLRTIWRLMIPRTLALGASQLNLLVLTGVVSYLSAGSLTVFNFATNLASLPVAVFGISYALAAFPALTEKAHAEDHAGFRDSFAHTASQILLFIIPTTVLFLILRAQIVRVVLGSSVAFDWDDTVTTFTTLAWLSVSLFAQALAPLLIRGLYAHFDSLIPLLAGIIGDVLTLLLSVILLGRFHVVGVAMAFSVGVTIQVIVLWLVLHHRAGGLMEKRILVSVFKFLVAAAVMAFVVQGMKTGLGVLLGTSTFLAVFSQAAIATVLGGITYLVVLVLLGSDEIAELIEVIENRIFSFAVVREGMDEGEGI